MHTLCIDTGSGPNIQDTQRRSLAELEDIIAKGKATLIEVGEALIEIHSRRLYKPRYKNFKTYLAERWQISRAHGYPAIAAAKLPKTEMSPNETKSETETQTSKPKEKRAKRKPTVVEDLDVKSEFAKIQERVELWAAKFTQTDYLDLIKDVSGYLELALNKAGYTDDLVVNQAAEVKEAA
jgi:hypothetical protein